MRLELHARYYCQVQRSLRQAGEQKDCLEDFCQVRRERLATGLLMDVRIKARAIAIRCFWPPLSWLPLLPTCVSKPLGKRISKFEACGGERRTQAATR